MEGASFKSILIFLLLAILAFVVGSLASEKAIDALVPIVLIAGTFALVALGKHCWWLIFLAPPILGALQFSFLQSFPVAYAICGIVLVYWLLMSFLGYVRSTWNGVLLLDLISLVFVAYFLFTWVRHPVTIQAFTSITDFGYTDVGGREYFWCLGAILCYLAFSVIPITTESAIRAMKIAFWLALIAGIMSCVKTIFLGGGALVDEMVDSRFAAFESTGRMILYYIFAKYSIAGIIISPWKCCVMFLGSFAMLLSGGRGGVLYTMLYVLCISFFKRQLVIVFILFLLTWAGLVFFSKTDLFEKVPYGVQRVCSSVPGVQIDNRALLIEAKGSLDWRYEMWEWAMDPSKGYIKDYTWGDGFGLSQYRARLDQVAIGMGLSNWGDNVRFAKLGVWHSGYITTIHRIGYVGLVFLSCWMFVSLIVVYRVCCSIYRIKACEYVYIRLVPFIPGLHGFFYGTGTFELLFSSTFYNITIAKLFYSNLVKKGDIRPLFAKEQYVPEVFRS